MDDKTTLKDARERTMTQAERGVDCPLCTRRVKLYKRRLHRQMARFLERLYDYAKGRGLFGTYRTRDFIPSGEKASTDASYLIHWGLIDHPSRGYYGITPKGIDWLNGKIKVRERAHILCGEKLGMFGPLISFEEALAIGAEDSYR